MLLRLNCQIRQLALILILCSESMFAHADILVSSYGTDEILRYDEVTGNFLGVFASDGGLKCPTDLVFGRDNNLYVASFHSKQILRYSGTTGAFIDVFASGTGLGNPTGLAFGPDENLYVTQQNHLVVRFDSSTGTFIDVFASGNGLSDVLDLTFGGSDDDLFVKAQGLVRSCVSMESPVPSKKSLSSYFSFQARHRRSTLA
jgi:hypothetical protein